MYKPQTPQNLPLLLRPSEVFRTKSRFPTLPGLSSPPLPVHSTPAFLHSSSPPAQAVSPSGVPFLLQVLHKYLHLSEAHHGLLSHPYLSSFCTPPPPPHPRLTGDHFGVNIYKALRGFPGGPVAKTPSS